MNTLQIVYKILHTLDHVGERSLIGQLISPEKLDITTDEWFGVMSLLIDEGCVSGVSFIYDIYGRRTASVENAHITLKGAEYLHTSDVMRKYHAAASGYTFDDEYYHTSDVMRKYHAAASGYIFDDEYYAYGGE